MKKVVLAVDAGGTKFKSALIDFNGRVLDASFVEFPVDSSGSVDAIFDVYGDTFAHAWRCAKKDNLTIVGMGISTPGPFDYALGVSWMTHKFAAIHGLPLRDLLYEKSELPKGLPIVFCQDVHAFLLGEYWQGAFQYTDFGAAITLGTGLGFGVLKSGRLLDNGAGGPYCVIYNRPYGTGTLEERISRRGIRTSYQRIAGKDESLDVLDIARLARDDHDENAITVFAETGIILAQELAPILNQLNVKNVLFGGQISRSYDLFGPSFLAESARMGLELDAVPGTLIATSALLGASKNLLIQETL